MAALRGLRCQQEHPAANPGGALRFTFGQVSDASCIKEGRNNYQHQKHQKNEDCKEITGD